MPWLIKKCEWCDYSALNRTDYYEHRRQCLGQKRPRLQKTNSSFIPQTDVTVHESVSPSVCEEPGTAESRSEFLKRIGRVFGNFLLELRHGKHVTDNVLNMVISQCRVLLGETLLRYTSKEETELTVQLLFSDFRNKYYLG